MKKAFSFIELAIVILVISALIAVIILVGDLREMARFNALMQQLSGYNMAMERFHDKYKALPGDMDFAYDIWGSDCESIVADCNGNGDRIIGERTTGTRERYMAWRHLFLADFIAEDFDGEEDNTVSTSVPLGKYPNSRLSFPSVYDIDGTSTGTGHNSLYVVADDSACATREIFTSAQIYKLDKKFDDGTPNGTISATENTACTPNSSSCADSSSYQNITDNGTIRCWMYFETSFSWLN